MATTGQWMAFAKAADGRILGASSNGIYRTSDGQNWEQVKADRKGGSFAVLPPSATLPNGRILATHYTKDIWKSDDNGESWTPTNSGMHDWASVSIVSDNNVLAVGRGIWKSFDSGENWVIQDGTEGTWLWQSLGVVSKCRVLSWGISRGIWKSDDNGRTWGQIANTSNKSWLTFVSPFENCILAGSENGIWKSDDNGETWVPTSKTDGRWLSFSIEPNGVILAGSGSNKGIWYSNDGYTWNPTNKTTGDVFALFSDE